MSFSANPADSVNNLTPIDIVDAGNLSSVALNASMAGTPMIRSAIARLDKSLRQGRKVSFSIAVGAEPTSPRRYKDDEQRLRATPLSRPTPIDPSVVPLSELDISVINSEPVSVATTPQQSFRSSVDAASSSIGPIHFTSPMEDPVQDEMETAQRSSLLSMSTSTFATDIEPEEQLRATPAHSVSPVPLPPPIFATQQDEVTPQGQPLFNLSPPALARYHVLPPPTQRRSPCYSNHLAPLVCPLSPEARLRAEQQFDDVTSPFVRIVPRPNGYTDRPGVIHHRPGYAAP